jgi:hypothetical protein
MISLELLSKLESILCRGSNNHFTSDAVFMRSSIPNGCAQNNKMIFLGPDAFLKITCCFPKGLSHANSDLRKHDSKKIGCLSHHCAAENLQIFLGRVFEQALRVDRPPSALSFAALASLPATQGQRSGVSTSLIRSPGFN